MKRASVNMGTFALVGMLILLPIGALAQQAPAETAKPSEGIVHTVVAGDTLWDLSAKYLGSPWKWTEIWERNRFLTNPHYIYPGVQVVIVPPGPREIALGQEPASASGTAEAIAVVALGFYGVGKDDAVSYAIVYHITTFVPITLLGLHALSQLRIRFGDLRAARTAPP